MNTFDAAVGYVKQLPPNDGTITQKDRLLLYGLYKVATVGDPPLNPKSSRYVDIYKHNAWEEAANTCISRDHAKSEYVHTLNTLIRSHSTSPRV
jgi:acyl-CoA-binding protein